MWAMPWAAGDFVGQHLGSDPIVQWRAEEGPQSAVWGGLLQKLSLNLTVLPPESVRALLCGRFNVDFSREQNTGKISQEIADREK